MLLNAQGNGALTAQTQKMIAKANKDGPYLGLVIPNLFELKYWTLFFNLQTTRLATGP